MKKILSGNELAAAELQLMNSGNFSFRTLIAIKARSFTATLLELYPWASRSFIVCCGLESKGGTGILIASLLKTRGADVKVWLINTSGVDTAASSAALPGNNVRLDVLEVGQLLRKLSIPYTLISDSAQLETVSTEVVVDALLETGLIAQQNTLAYNVINHLNQTPCEVVSVDSPSGFKMEGAVPQNNMAVHADEVICFHQPHFAFFLPDSLPYVQHFHEVDVLIYGEEIGYGFFFTGKGKGDDKYNKHVRELLQMMQDSVDSLREASQEVLHVKEKDLGLGNVDVPELQRLKGAGEYIFNLHEAPFLATNYTSGDYLLSEPDIKAVMQPRRPFSHKGTFGHALIIAGSSKTMGAALITAECCLRTGSGLTTLCVPEIAFSTVNARVPELMTLAQENLAEIPASYNTVAIGPGLGKSARATQLLQTVLEGFKGHVVLDADALNLLAELPQFKTLLRPGWILTPHVKEFDRLFGAHQSWWARIQTAREIAVKAKVIVVLKNQYTFIFLPDGRSIINRTGNPAMANGGMGDALTGIIVSLLAQGYAPEIAAYAGCYIHGKAGDELYAEGNYVVTATDIAAIVPKVMYKLQQ